MIKMEISLDENKIISEGLSLSEIIDNIDYVFDKLELKKSSITIGNLVYEGTDSKNDFANFGNAISFLKEKEWFLPYVNKWLWFNNDGENDKNNFRCEDIALYYKNKNVLKGINHA